MESIYKLVDNIYCISLISRPDRYENMKLFEKEEKIKLDFYRPKKHSNGRIGCFTSHIKCIQDAFLKKYSMIMIFEDDVVKTPHYNKIDYEEIKNLMLVNTDWEILKFSSNAMNPIYILKPNEYNFMYNGPTLLGTAYILNKKGINTVMNTYTKYIQSTHLDVYYHNIFSNTTYNVMPIPLDQRWDMGSDNIWEYCTPQIQSYMRNMLNYDLNYYMSFAKYYNEIIIMILIFMFINKQIFGLLPYVFISLLAILGLFQTFLLRYYFFNEFVSAC